MPIEGTVLGAMFLGVQAAVIAVIVRAVHRIGEHILFSRWLWLTAIAVAAASLAGVSFWIVLPAAGAVYALIFAVAVAIMYRWKSKLATPLVLAIGARVSAVALG